MHFDIIFLHEINVFGFTERCSYTKPQRLKLKSIKLYLMEKILVPILPCLTNCTDLQQLGQSPVLQFAKCMALCENTQVTFELEISIPWFGSQMFDMVVMAFLPATLKATHFGKGRFCTDIVGSKQSTSWKYFQEKI